MAAVVMFRGRRACPCLAEWIPVYEAELKRLGEIKSKVDIAQLIGTYVKSGTTHVPGGAGDFWQHSKRAVAIAEEMGAAAFERGPAQGFAWHMHFVLKGCPHNAGGRYQVVAREAGYNGLGANGRGARDPRGAIKLRTWEQGIRWARARQKQVTPKPKLRTTDISCSTFNVKSKTSGFVRRVPVIDERVRLHRPTVAVFQELQPGADKRTPLSQALARTHISWSMTSNYANKVQYLRDNDKGWTKVRSAKYPLGNSRHALAVLYRHRNTGAEVVVATPHLSYAHSDGKQRAAEAKQLVAFLRRDFKGKEWLVVGDFNDSHKKTKTRPVNSTGVVLRAAGLHDLSFDPTMANKHGRAFNTAHQNKTPAPASGVHLENFYGTPGLAGLLWLNDVHEGRRGGDHWLVYMDIRITHPVK